MRNNCGKKLLLALLSLCCLSTAFAANNTAGAQPNDGGASNAIAFAIQAGQIAGSAQGCGINISTFTTRVSEAINKLALNPTDSAAAINSFQQTLQQAQIAQRNNNTIPCSQVNQDFNSLPLLKPDYEQSVIAQLTPGMTNNQNTNQTGNTATAPAMGGNMATGNNPAANQQQGMQNNANAGMPNQQQNLNNQAMPNTGTNNPNMPNTQANNQGNNAANKNPLSNMPNNPAYPQQNYGPAKSFSTNYPGAVRPYGMANMDSQGSSTAAAPAQQPQQPSNNPPPPNFSNPNNSPAANSGYPNQ